MTANLDITQISIANAKIAYEQNRHVKLLLADANDSSLNTVFLDHINNADYWLIPEPVSDDGVIHLVPYLQGKIMICAPSTNMGQRRWIYRATNQILITLCDISCPFCSSQKTTPYQKYLYCEKCYRLFNAT